MEIRFDVKMDVKTMYNFLLYYNYTKFQTILGTIVGFLAVMLALGQEQMDSRAVLYLAIGILLIAYTPLSLYLRAQKQVKLAPVYKKPIMYKLTEEGITTEQDGKESMIKWENVEKVTSTNKSILVFVSKIHVSILPKTAIGEKYESVVWLVSTHVPPEKVKIKS